MADFPKKSGCSSLGPGAARVGMRDGEVKVLRATEGEACLDAGQSARASLPVPARACFDRLLLPLGTIYRCRNAPKRRSWQLTAQNRGNVGYSLRRSILVVPALRIPSSYLAMSSGRR
jgi:hypothetical protein